MADERDGHTSVNSELLKRVAGSPSSGSTPSKRKKPQLEIAVTKKRSVGKSVAVQTESVQPILDPTTLPRLTASMTVAALKKEATGRGLNKGLSKYNKQGLLDLLGGEGSIHLTAVPEFKYLESVRNLMEDEKGHWAQKARQKAEAREQEKAKKSQEEAKKRCEEEKARSLKAEEEQRQARLAQFAQVEPLHFHTTLAHRCKLAKTASLPSPGGAGRRVDVACCNVCGGDYLDVPTPCTWTWVQCDFDICPKCYEIESLPAHKRQEAILARRRQEEDELQREQKRHEEERQRELDLIVGNPVPSRVKQVPPKFKRRSKSGFTVWSSFGYGNDGWHSYAGPPPKELADGQNNSHLCRFR